MFTKTLAITLASAFMAAEAIAVNMHRHGHQQLHNRRAIVYGHTEVVVHTEWVTVTVYEDEATTSSPAAVFKETPSTTTTSSSSTSSSSSSTPPPPAAVETTSPQAEAEVVAPAPSTPAVVAPAPAAPAPAPVQQVEAAAPTTAAATPASTPGSTGGSTTGGKKRGLAYNNANLLPAFMGGESQISWAYNWGQRSDGLSIGVDYCPMLWGPVDMHTNTWKANAEAAIKSGTKHFLSFNECDNKGQCNLDAASAAREHIKWMNPYAASVRVSTPAITNSNLAGEGLDWLKAWISACNGQCAFDFCAAHWYSPPVVSDFLGHMEKVHEICGKNVWITEFEPISGDKAAFLQEVMKEMDTNPKYAFIERYSYFMASEGNMVSGTSLSSVGNTFAYST